MLKEIVGEVKAALIILVGVTAIHTIGDDVAHFLKNQALDSIEVDDTKTEEEKKAAISEALNNKQLYNNGVILEAVHDFLGEQKNPDNGFDDIDSGWIGVFDLFDVIPDRTKMEKSPTTTDNGKAVTEDATVAINWGEVTPVNLVIKYKQKMQGTLDFRRKEEDYIDPISNLDTRKMGSNKPANTENIRILLRYLYTNFYANDPNKIIIEEKHKETESEAEINSIVKVYEDSFSNIPSPNTKSNEVVKLGFKYKGDSRESKKEYEKAYEETKSQWVNTGLSFNPEILRTRTSSKNANSYFASKKYYEEHKNRFSNYINDILNANDADSVQVCFTFFCFDLYNSTKSNIDEVLKSKNKDIKVTDNTEVRVYHCKFKDRDKEENKDNYETVKLSNIKWPDELKNIYKVRNELPLILPKDRYNKSIIMTETELDKIKREQIDADTQLPKIEDGETSSEDEIFYTVYDWKNIEDVKDKEDSEKEGTENGQAMIDIKMDEFNKNPNYIAGITEEIIDGYEIEL